MLDTDIDTDARPAEPQSSVPRFLGRVEVAKHLGLSSVRSLSRIKLPEPDVMVGPHKGWLPETIDEWNSRRPGRGRWGARGPR
jgi:hypothetical protein